MRVKIAKPGEIREVFYSEEHLTLLRELRDRAREILLRLSERGITAYAHGSIARGDVHKNSDIDVVVLDPVSIALLVSAIESLGGYDHASIVMATPTHTPKIYFYLDPIERIVVSAPLSRLSLVEQEFYYFGGLADLEKLFRGIRVPGVDKRLMLIIPTERGHIEQSIIGREAEVARILGISISTIMDRVKTLTRRDMHGRTGVYINSTIPSHGSVEEAIKRLCARYPIFRRRVSQENLC